MIEIRNIAGNVICQVYADDLFDACLRDTCLRDADLIGKDLNGSDLTGADLTGAYLRDAGLDGADLSDAHGIIDLGQDPRGYRFVAVWHASGWHISAGCRWFALPEALAHWSAKNNRDALARLAILEAHPHATATEE